VLQYDVSLLTAMMATDCDANWTLLMSMSVSSPVPYTALLSAFKLAPDQINVVPELTAFTDVQAADKGTKLVDEDGLFSLVAAAPETAAAAAAKPEVKAEGASVLAAIPAGNFYTGKSSAATGAQAKKAALSASSMAAAGALCPLNLLSIAFMR